MHQIMNTLFELQDKTYADFQAKLIPGVSREDMIGVRIPALRKYAKQLYKTPECEVFITELPHSYYDENVLHAILVSEIKDYEECVKEINKFLPYVDNWGVCDTMSPKVFKKHHEELIQQVYAWINSKLTYTSRFGMKILMAEYLEKDFKPEYLEWPASVKSDAYYVNMMTAWFFATALAKQWDATIPYIIEYRLPVWVHQKTIQKACESYRITADRKSLLKTYKVK